MYAGINQKATPIRYFFLIQPERQDRFQRAVQIAFSVWGGVNAPVFSYYGELPPAYRYEFQIDLPTLDYYRNTIENFDPDTIIYDEDITEAAVSAIAGERKCISIESYLSELDNNRFEQAISFLEIGAYLKEKEFKFVRHDDLVLSLPIFPENELLLRTFMGELPEFVRSEMKKIFNDSDVLEEPEVFWEVLDEYRKKLNIDIIQLNNYRLSSWVNKHYKRGSAIYILRPNRLQDIQNFWNLRAAGWQVLPLPIGRTELPVLKTMVQAYTEWQARQHNGDHAMVTLLIGFGLTREAVDTAWGHVTPDTNEIGKKVMYVYQSLFPRYWSTYRIQDADMIKSHIPFFETDYKHYEPNEGRIEFQPLEVPFTSKRNLYRESAYKIIFELSAYDEQSSFAEVLDGITTRQLRNLTGALDFRTWRLSNAGIHRLIRDADDKIHISLPESLPFFRFYFANKGFQLKETANSKLAKEVLKNIGGLTYGKFLLQTGPLKIIELFEGGREITYPQLVAEIKQQLGLKKKEEIKEFIERLLEHRIVEMGGIVQCAVCEQHGFYLPVHIREEITCPICRNEFPLPMAEPNSIAWAYRGIGPFTRTNKADGVMAVFATLGFFHREFADTSGKLSSLFGFELGRKNEPAPAKEVDLALLLRNKYDDDRSSDLLFCECKTYKRFTEKDAERMKLLGQQFPNSVLVFATLNNELDEEERVLIAGLAKYFQQGYGERPVNPVLILTGSEVLSEDFDQLAAYDQQLKPYNRYNDLLGSLCEFSVARHLTIENWWEIKDRKWREGIFRRGMIQNIILGLKEKASIKAGATK
ncbi:hypothetical protein SNE25_12865 [Mucilaginibacter sabulilitoris]|uniref:Uncharacterized protein n=1 Tax=Mucilaginibacter sabulilitoris TaxID=1173583 RepID=A0ABZ0TUI8_9SPHI|nr:hypothetical protein [Mucilaginibacter sabulilitoris]WPU96411.1 hypothetical protein SNE25_12865 [Mucilaginibacter sabulilitoris]